jgi:recombination protein RecT
MAGRTANTAELQTAITNKQQAPAAAAAPNRREIAFKQLHNLFERSANELKKVLPTGITPERIARVTLTACRKNPALLDCNPSSIIGAVFQASQLGLQIDVLGSAYLVPYKDQVQLIIGYKGYIDLAYRSPRVISIQAHTVYANDIFKMDNGSQPYLKHEQSEEPSEEIRGFYAIAHLQNGGCLWYYMSRKQVEAHRDENSSDYKYKKSKGWEKNSVWGKHFEPMAKKTVLRQLMTWLPMEIEQKEFMAYDGTVRSDINSEPEYIEADWEITEEEAAAE